MKAVPKTH